MEHSLGCFKVVTETRPYVKEIAVEQVRERLAKNPQAVLLDMREDHEWQQGHAEQAVHLGKGILEQDWEERFPDPDRELMMYCGGGYRSILTAAAAQKMGYRNVFSVADGYKALVQPRWPIKNGN